MSSKNEKRSQISYLFEQLEDLLAGDCLSEEEKREISLEVLGIIYGEDE